MVCCHSGCFAVECWLVVLLLKRMCYVCVCVCVCVCACVFVHVHVWMDSSVYLFSSPGFGCSLAAESTSGVVLSAEVVAQGATLPEDLGAQAAQLLCDEVQQVNVLICWMWKGEIRRRREILVHIWWQCGSCECNPTWRIVHIVCVCLVCVCVCVRLCSYLCIYDCMYVCMYVCMKVCLVCMYECTNVHAMSPNRADVSTVLIKPWRCCTWPYVPRMCQKFDLENWHPSPSSCVGVFWFVFVLLCRCCFVDCWTTSTQFVSHPSHVKFVFQLSPFTLTLTHTNNSPTHTIKTNQPTTEPNHLLLSLPSSHTTLRFLRHLKDYFGIVFKLKADPDSHTVLLSCLGVGFKNLAKATC